ncbi:hypothetical protein D3C84_1133140 [compost metagenome]
MAAGVAGEAYQGAQEGLGTQVEALASDHHQAIVGVDQPSTCDLAGDAHVDVGVRLTEQYQYIAVIDQGLCQSRW